MTRRGCFTFANKSASQVASLAVRSVDALLRCQLIEQRLRLFQVERLEAFGEPVVDRCEQIVGFLALTLRLPQAREAGRRAQLPRLRLLLARKIQRGEVVFLGACEIPLERKHPTLEAQDFG